MGEPYKARFVKVEAINRIVRQDRKTNDSKKPRAMAGPLVSTTFARWLFHKNGFGGGFNSRRTGRGMSVDVGKSRRLLSENCLQIYHNCSPLCIEDQVRDTRGEFPAPKLLVDMEFVGLLDVLKGWLFAVVEAADLVCAILTLMALLTIFMLTRMMRATLNKRT